MFENRTIFHIDVNSAFLSWSAVYMLKNGAKQDIRLIPSVVGGDETKRKGVVLAKSIPAKKYNISTGEPLYFARKKCKNLVVVPPNFEIYTQYSDAMFDILYEFSPYIEKFSIDECFLDYTGMEKHFGPALEGAKAISEKIKKNLGFTVNIGVSSNKVLAKMASDFSKPDKIHTLYPNEIKQKMWPLPVQDLFMLGKKTAESLQRKGVYTIGDLAKWDLELMKYYYKKNGETLWQYANGIDNSPVVWEPEHQKGIGASTTTIVDIDNYNEAYKLILGLCETVSFRLRKMNCYTKLISVNIKTTDFKTYSKQLKLDVETNSTNEIFNIAKILFNKLWQGEPLRHLGVSLGKLSNSKFHQISFWEDEQQEKENNLDASIDKIRKKFGNSAVKRGTFAKNGEKHMFGNVDGKMFPD